MPILRSPYPSSDPYRPDQNIALPSGEGAIHDGDTYIDASGRRVRLSGIDAPEMANPNKETPRRVIARESTEGLANYLQNAGVNVADKGTDLYGRTIGDINNGDASVSQVRALNASPKSYGGESQELRDRLQIAHDMGLAELRNGASSPTYDAIRAIQVDPNRGINHSGPVYKSNGLIGNALSRGTDNMQGMLYGGVHAGARALNEEAGLDTSSAQNWAQEGMATNEQESGHFPAKYNTWDDAHGLSGKLGYTAEKIAENLPQQVPMIAGGIAAGMLAPEVAVPLAGRTVLGFLSKSLGSKAVGAGAFGANMVSQAGEVEQEQMGLDPSVRAPAREVLGIAAPRAALDVLSAKIGLDGLVGATSAKGVKDVAVQLLKASGIGALAEAPTETAQEALAIGLRAAHDPSYDPFGKDSIARLKESAIAGGVVGAGMGGASRGGGIALKALSGSTTEQVKAQDKAGIPPAATGTLSNAARTGVDLKAKDEIPLPDEAPGGLSDKGADSSTVTSSATKILEGGVSSTATGEESNGLQTKSAEQTGTKTEQKVAPLETGPLATALQGPSEIGNIEENNLHEQFGSGAPHEQDKIDYEDASGDSISSGPENISDAKAILMAGRDGVLSPEHESLVNEYAQQHLTPELEDELQTKSPEDYSPALQRVMLGLHNSDLGSQLREALDSSKLASLNQGTQDELGEVAEGPDGLGAGPTSDAPAFTQHRYRTNSGREVTSEKELSTEDLVKQDVPLHDTKVGALKALKEHAMALLDNVKQRSGLDIHELDDGRVVATPKGVSPEDYMSGNRFVEMVPQEHNGKTVYVVHQDNVTGFNEDTASGGMSADNVRGFISGASLKGTVNKSKDTRINANEGFVNPFGGNNQIDAMAITKLGNRLNGKALISGAQDVKDAFLRGVSELMHHGAQFKQSEKPLSDSKVATDLDLRDDLVVFRTKATTGVPSKSYTWGEIKGTNDKAKQMALYDDLEKTIKKLEEEQSAYEETGQLYKHNWSKELKGFIGSLAPELRTLIPADAMSGYSPLQLARNIQKGYGQNLKDKGYEIGEGTYEPETSPKITKEVNKDGKTVTVIDHAFDESDGSPMTSRANAPSNNLDTSKPEDITYQNTRLSAEEEVANKEEVRRLDAGIKPLKDELQEQRSLLNPAKGDVTDLLDTIDSLEHKLTALERQRAPVSREDSATEGGLTMGSISQSDNWSDDDYEDGGFKPDETAEVTSTSPTAKDTFNTRLDEVDKDPSVLQEQKRKTLPNKTISAVHLIESGDKRVIGFLRELASKLGIKARFHIIDQAGKESMIKALRAQYKALNNSAQRKTAKDAVDQVKHLRNYIIGKQFDFAGFSRELADMMKSKDPELVKAAKKLKFIGRKMFAGLEHAEDIDKSYRTNQNELFDKFDKATKDLRDRHEELETRLALMKRTADQIKDATGPAIFYNDASSVAEDREAIIYLPSTKGQTHIANIKEAAHEFGHLIKRVAVDQLIDKARAGNKEAIKLVDNLFGKVDWTDDQSVYLADEQFAKMTEKWALSHAVPRTALQKFFSGIGKQLRRMYESVKAQFSSDKEASQYKTFESFLDALLYKESSYTKTTASLSGIGEKYQNYVQKLVDSLNNPEYLARSVSTPTTHNYTGDEMLDNLARNMNKAKTWSTGKPLLGTVAKTLETTGNIVGKIGPYVKATGISLRELSPYMADIAQAFHIMPGETAPTKAYLEVIGKEGAVMQVERQFRTIPEEMRYLYANKGIHEGLLEVLNKLPSVSGMDFLSSAKRSKAAAAYKEIGDSLIDYTLKRKTFDELSPEAQAVAKYFETLREKFIKDPSYSMVLPFREQYHPLIIDKVIWDQKRTEILQGLIALGWDGKRAAEWMRKASATDGALDAAIELDDVFAPGMSAKKARDLELNVQQMLADLGVYSSDLHSIVGTYTHQIVKRATVQSHFGGYLRDPVTGEYITEEYNDKKTGLKAVDKYGAPRARKVYHPMAQLKYQIAKMGQLYQTGAVDGVSPEDMKRVQEKYMPALLGTLGSNIDPKLSAIMSWTQLGVNMMMLPLSVTSSVVDLGGIGLMSEVQSNPFRAVSDSIKMSKYFTDSKYRAEITQMAKMLGIINDHAIDSVLSESAALETMTPTAKRINEKFFELIQMKRWTNFSRILATQFAMDSLKSYAAKIKAGDPSGLKAISELSLEQQELEDWVRLGANMSDVKDFPGVQAAVARWVDMAVLRPEASLRPPIGSDRRAALFWHLKEFMYTFYYVTMKRAWTQMKDQESFAVALPAIALAAFSMSLAMAGYGLRKLIAEEIAPRAFGLEPKYKTPEGVDAFEEYALRAGLLGPFTILHDMYNADKHGSLALTALMGPAFSKLVEFMDKDTASFLVHSIPGVAQSSTIQHSLQPKLEKIFPKSEKTYE